MASVIKLKRNTSAGQVPSSGALQQGELAINLADKKLFSSSDGSDIIQISGDAYEVNTVANTTSGSVKLTGTGNASNSQVNFVGANGIGITSNSTGVFVTANTVDVDLATAANAASANLILSGGGETETIKIVGDDHIVVAGTNTSHISVKLTNAVSVASVQTSGNTVVGGDVDITGEVNAASAAIRGAAVVTTTLAAGNTTVTGFVNASSQVDVGANVTLDTTSLKIGNSTVNTSISSSAIHSDATVDLDSTLNVAGDITAGADVDITGEVNAASAAIVGNASVGGNMAITGTLTVSGGTTTVESTTVTINDSLLSLADNQTGTDTDAVDVGFYGTFDEGGTDKYSGFFRDQNHANKAFVVVEGITAEPGSTISYSASDLGQLDAVIDGGTY